MKSLTALLISVSLLFVSACSDESENKASGEHVWKEQTDALDKAKELEATMLKSAEERAKSMQDQMQ